MREVRKVLRSARRIIDCAVELNGTVDLNINCEGFLVEVHWANFDGKVTLVKGDINKQFSGVKAVNDAIDFIESIEE